VKCCYTFLSIIDGILNAMYHISLINVIDQFVEYRKPNQMTTYLHENKTSECFITFNLPQYQGILISLHLVYLEVLINQYI
jgi:hypothetical protein